VEAKKRREEKRSGVEKRGEEIMGREGRAENMEGKGENRRGM
jgi:hypothetical protein